MLEIMTYRFRGHSMGDPERYRKQEEVKKWEENDPIGIFRKQLISKKTATAKQLDEMDAKVLDEVEQAVQFAESSPEPTTEDLYADIYAKTQ
jgi:pyruvate dehydrogenase E1 component alpha subunit